MRGQNHDSRSGGDRILKRLDEAPPSLIQVGKHESLARHNFTHLHRQLPLEHRTCIDECVEFPVLSAGIDVCWEVREQLLIKLSTDEFLGEEFGVNASEFRTHTGFDHGTCKLARGRAPQREYWLQPGISHLLLA